MKGALTGKDWAQKKREVTCAFKLARFPEWREETLISTSWVPQMGIGAKI